MGYDPAKVNRGNLGGERNGSGNDEDGWIVWGWLYQKADETSLDHVASHYARRIERCVLLWQKPVESITFADVDAFLQAKVPEGHRHEYKLTFPGDLAKTIAAFANTLGGLIVLGVEGDKVNNEPIWPPTAGMPDSVGIADRIVQIATEAIYPPVRVGVAQMENTSLPGHQIAVIRVDESREAPHAVEKKSKVYVYERSDNKIDRYVLADIDRIKHLLERRHAIESKREQLIEKCVAKLRTELTADLRPQCWVSVAPVYPWREICRPSECYETLKKIAGEIGSPYNSQFLVQRIPDGAFVRIQSLLDQSTRTSKMTDAAIIRSNGIFVYMRTILSLDRRHDWGVGLISHEKTEKYFQMPSFWDRIPNIFKYARSFYDRDGVEMPGLLSLQFGLEGMLGYRMGSRDRESFPYTEDDYRDSDFADASTFLNEDSCFDTMRKRFVFGFDFETPEGM